MKTGDGDIGFIWLQMGSNWDQMGSDWDQIGIRFGCGFGMSGDLFHGVMGILGGKNVFGAEGGGRDGWFGGFGYPGFGARVRHIPVSGGMGTGGYSVSARYFALKLLRAKQNLYFHSL